ncbi:apolipoprotein N-acyltransferase [Sulfurimonas sp. SAG-AH-194-C21]|nr:apolipoprotein N-acyltransferase [Sulfurimonas sp. SAG-AH-194-C21]MDF1882645.1 apolipoprotein N-acyltransferase [Sulfurimonas sp. SAG-AH-194-C21]
MNKITQTISLGLLTAICFSAFIYLDFFSLTNRLLNTLFALSSLALFLYIPKKAILVAGGSIGILWFYWIGYSFEYQGVGYMTPIITLAFGFIYLLFFLPLFFTEKAYIRAILLFGLSFIEPFDWNWLQIELVFVETYIGIFKYQLALVLLSLSLPALIENKTYRYLPLILLLSAFNFSQTVQKDAPLKIKLISTDIKQEYKWTREAYKPTLNMIFSRINTAIEEKYELIVFPESVFPLYMNHNPALVQKLLVYSKKISIIVGSLLKENNHNYNVTYLFQDGEYKVAKKLVLVPFGEYIPLPKFAQDIINKTFFSGASDFVTADAPTDFLIKGVKFRNAICYEATCQEIYEGEVEFLIATSNNAWFAPSIESTLQNLLLKYYARKNHVTIFHSANYKGTGIIH